MISRPPPASGTSGRKRHLQRRVDLGLRECRLVRVEPHQLQRRQRLGGGEQPLQLERERAVGDLDGLRAEIDQPAQEALQRGLGLRQPARA